MRRLSLFKTLTLSILFVCLSICSVMFVATTKTVKAETPVSFEMDAGAYVKLVEDGGMRMRVVMDETTKNSVLEDGNELFFLLMTEDKFANAKTDDGYNFDQYLTNCDNFNEDGCVKVVADKSLIYANDGAYYSNLLIYNFPTEWLNQTICAVAGKTIASETVFASFESDSQVCKKMYEIVNYFALSQLAPQIFDVYGDWYATEEYPVAISTQTQYDGLADFISNVYDLSGKNVEIGADVDRDLAYENESLTSVNLVKNEFVVTFMVNGVVYEKVQVAKNALVTAPATDPEISDATATYEFIGWDYDFSTAVTEDIVINANFNLISKDISSLFKFTNTESIVADTTWSDFGKIKYSQTNQSRSDYVDVSEYQGMTLRITIPNLSYYGLVFYTEKNQLTGQKKDQGWSYINSAGNTGSVAVVDIIIPTGANYVRTAWLNPDGQYGSVLETTTFSALVYQKTEEDITSLFKFTGTEAIVADTTWSDFGNIKYGVSSLSRSDYVDVSAYQGKTLRITMPNSSSYGLAFYTEKNQATDSKATGWSYKIASGNSGDVHIVEIVIPETAVYVRTTYYYEKGTYGSSVSENPFSAVVYEKSEEDITSLFVFTKTEGLVANKTWADFGQVKYGLSNWQRTDFVDISAYQGKTLRITVPNGENYGLVFYSEIKYSACSKDEGWSYTNATGVTGDIHIVEIKIPETAVCLRTSYYNPDGSYGAGVATTPFSAQIIG